MTLAHRFANYPFTAMWSAVREALATARRQGCNFHWTQAITKKIKALGLWAAYNNNEGTHCYIKRIMVIPSLPQEHTQPAFAQLQKQAPADSSALMDLCNYVDQTWFKSSLWQADNGCVYQPMVGTNNDIEGWHL